VVLAPDDGTVVLDIEFWAHGVRAEVGFELMLCKKA
jgi:hypothetical protein